MTDKFLKRKSVYRGCILYEFFRGKPIFESYETLCKVFGDVIDYRDFEFWFMRFANGKLMLNYKRGSELEFDRTFSELSVDILEKIVDNLDFMDRLVVRKVSRSLRSLIDTRTPKVKQIGIKSHPNQSTSVKYDSNIVNYREVIGGCSVMFGEKRRKKIENGNHFEMAINDLKIVMEHRNLQLKQFNIIIDSYNPNPENINNFCKFFADLQEKNGKNRTIHVECLTFPIFDQIEFPILPYFKPKVLKKIRIIMRSNKKEKLEEMMEMEQWKKAKCVQTTSGCPFPMPIETLFHLTRFVIHLNFVTDSDIMKIRDVLMRSQKFKHCTLTTSKYMDIPGIKELFDLDGDENMYKVPDTDNVFEIAFLGSNRIEILKL